jgi:hypothetical protein
LRQKGHDIKGCDKYVCDEDNNINIKNEKFDIIFSNNFIDHIIDALDDISSILSL